MSASRELKEAGVKGGVREAARICGRPESTLYEWYNNHYQLFQVIKHGCSEIIRSKNSGQSA